MTNCSIFAVEWLNLVEILSVLDITKRASDIKIQMCGKVANNKKVMFTNHPALIVRAVVRLLLI